VGQEQKVGSDFQDTALAKSNVIERDAYSSHSSKHLGTPFNKSKHLGAPEVDHEAFCSSTEDILHRVRAAYHYSAPLIIVIALLAGEF
jgi:hypothetical protein